MSERMDAFVRGHLRAVTLAHVAIAEQSGRGVLCDLDRGLYFGFDEVALHIWRALAEPRTYSYLVRDLEANYDVTFERATEDVANFVRSLYAESLLHFS